MILQFPCADGWDSQGFHSKHTAIDIGWLSSESPDGRTPIVAAADGEVYYEGYYPEKWIINGKPTTFNPIVVILKHTQFDENYDYYTAYWHLSSTCVDKGQKILRGTQIGIKGTTGYSNGVHLHFQVMKIRKNSELPPSSQWKPISINPIPLIRVFPGQKFVSRGNYTLKNYTGVSPVPRNTQVDQIKIVKSNLRIRTEANTTSETIGLAEIGYYDVQRIYQEKDYTWYQIDNHAFVAGVEGVLEYLPREKNKHLVVVKKEPNYKYQWSVIGAKYGSKYDIAGMNGFQDDRCVKEGWEQVIATNGGLFYTWDNAHYANGLEKSEGVNNQDISMSAVSDYNNAMAIGCTTNGDLVLDIQKNIVNDLSKYYGAVTGIGILKNGKPVEWGHREFASQYNTISGRTILGKDKDGNFMSYSIPGVTGKSGLYGRDMAATCLDLGFYDAICLDGGGSVFRKVYGKADITTSRKVKNSVMLYRIKSENPLPPSPDCSPLEEENKKLKELNAQLTQENNTLKTDNIGLTKENEELVTRNEELTNENSNLQAENSNLVIENKSYQETIQLVKDDLNNLLTKI